MGLTFPGFQEAVAAAWEHGLNEVTLESRCAAAHARPILSLTKLLRYPDPRFSVQKISLALEQLLHRTISSLAAEFNRHRPISLLPPELLIECFRWLMLSDRMAASLVCKSWSMLMFQAPRIWSAVSYSGSSIGAPVVTSLYALRRFFELSGECKMKVELSVSGQQQWFAIFDLVGQEMHRISFLQLNLEYTGCSAVELAALASLFTTPAPNLRVLTVYDATRHFDRNLFLGHPKIFDGQGPQLSDIVLHCDISAYEHSHGTFQSVQRVSLNNLGTLHYDHLANLIGLFPAAIDLSMSFEDWDMTYERPNLSISLPSSLRVLKIAPDGPNEVIPAVLDCLDWRAVPRVAVTRRDETAPCQQSLNLLLDWNPPEDSLQAADYISPFVVTTSAIDWYMVADKYTFDHGPIVHLYKVDAPMHVLLSHEAEHNVDIPTRDERVFFELGVPLPPGAFAHLVRIYLSELVFNDEVLSYPLPDLPSLTNLTIWIMPSAYHRDDQGFSVFTDVSLFQSRVSSYCSF